MTALYRLSISNLAWDVSEDAAVAALLHELHCPGIDLAPTKIWPDPVNISAETLARYCDTWTQQGIQIAGLQSLLFGQPDLQLFGTKEIRDKMLDYLAHICQLAQRLGADPLVFGSPRNRIKGDLSQSDAMNKAVEFFGRAAECAAQYHTTLCIEPNPAVYGCDFIQTTAEACQLLREVNHRGLRLTLDTAIMTLNGEDYRSSIELAMPWLYHVHVSEPQLQPIQTGIVNHVEIGSLLRTVGYDRWIAIEMRGDPTASAIETIRQAVTFTRRAYFA